MAKPGNPKLHPLLASAIAGRDPDLGAFEPGELVEAAVCEGVVALLFEHIHAGRVSRLDATAIDRLRAINRIEAARDLWQDEATRKTLALLAGEGVDALLLKGVPLAHLYYPASHQRPRSDTDLLIDSDQAGRAAECLARAGYQVSGLGKRKNASRQFGAALPGGPQAYTHFDLHWQLSNRVLFRESLQFAECREQAQPVPALGPNARALCTQHLLLHACIHRIAHGRGTERNRLIWLYDIHLLAAAMDEKTWEGFIESALRKRLGALCADALRTVQALFGSDIAASRIERLEENAQREPAAKLINASRVRWALSDLAEIPGLGAKLGLAKEFLLG